MDWYSPEGLREQAMGHEHDNQRIGDPGHCRPADADWTVETLQPVALKNVFASAIEVKE